MRVLRSTGLFIARILIASFFIVSGIMKIQNFAATEAMLAAKNIPFPQISLGIALAIELVGGIFLIFGFKTRWWSGILFLFILTSSVLLHDFWNYADAERVDQLYNFLKNMAILGGLLYVICCGPGGCSCDVCNCRKQVPPPPVEPENKL